MIIKKIIFFILLLFIQCSSNSTELSLEEWKEKKQDGFWYGIGMVTKPFYGESIHEAARNQAIADIASQIKININQEFKRVIEEFNHSISDYSLQVIESRINTTIEDFEIIDFKDSENSYMLMGRLSKAKYYENIDRKRSNAKDAALNYINSVKKPGKSAFEKLLKAESIIFPYLDNPLLVNRNGNSENLFNLINSLRSSLIERVNIVTDSHEIVVKNLVDKNIPIKVTLIDSETNEKIPNFPIVTSLNRNSSDCFTNKLGECDFFIKKSFFNKDRVQFYNISINKNFLGIDSEYFNVLEDQVILKLEPTNIFLDISENNLGQTIKHSYMTPTFKKYFSSNFNSNFVDNKKKSDIIIKAIVNTISESEQKNEFGLYKVFANATIIIMLREKDEPILEILIDDVSGADFNSNVQAGYKALDKLSKKIFNETLPELVSILN
ncbi:MAG: hypothetical protein CMG00_03135 [Candidatus Marinimicrobia bacterium]|nr:hypothetical protein [Candidatus Neomarinimicrobiota bacterium]|tara:strand:- start:798 stop:2114 length:1317 start_codon:yes stop_codon:yes gene_type:complete